MSNTIGAEQHARLLCDSAMALTACVYLCLAVCAAMCTDASQSSARRSRVPRGRMGLVESVSAQHAMQSSERSTSVCHRCPSHHPGSAETSF